MHGVHSDQGVQSGHLFSLHACTLYYLSNHLTDTNINILHAHLGELQLLEALVVLLVPRPGVGVDALPPLGAGAAPAGLGAGAPLRPGVL